MIIPMLMQGIGSNHQYYTGSDYDLRTAWGSCDGRDRSSLWQTLIGQFSACTLSIVLFVKKGQIALRIKGFRFDRNIVRGIYSVAVPSGVMCALPSILIGTLEWTAGIRIPEGCCRPGHLFLNCRPLYTCRQMGWCKECARSSPITMGQGIRSG